MSAVSPHGLRQRHVGDGEDVRARNTESAESDRQQVKDEVVWGKTPGGEGE